MRLLVSCLMLSLAVLLGCGSQVDSGASKPVAAQASQTEKVASEGAEVAVSTVVLKVPSMTCPHGCWPTVKETLEGQPGVAGVELAKQADADTIDKPEVTVKLSGDFDLKAAIEALAKAGHEGAQPLN